MIRHFFTAWWRQLRVIVLLLIAGYLSFAVLLAPSQASAISLNDINSLITDTPFFDANAEGCLSTGGTTLLHGADNQEKAFNYFIYKGVPAVGAAAIVGNLTEESSVNPQLLTQVDGSQSSPTTIPDDEIGKAAYGIDQWKDADRQHNLIAAAAKVNKLPGDLAVQLDYLWSEATSTKYQPVLDSLEKATDLKAATLLWMLGFERPDPSQEHFDDGLNSRLFDALAVAAKYGAQASSGGGGGCASTNFTTGFIFYKQCVFGNATPTENDGARSWQDNLYGHAKDPTFNTICNQGCGPTSMAMIIRNLTGEPVTPDMTAAYGQANGTADPGGDGSDGELLGPIIGGHWNLKSEPIPNFNIDQINRTLQNGGLVLAGGHMEQGPPGNEEEFSNIGPFSLGGHFVVIRALVNGKWLIGNPAGWPDDAQYDPEWVLAHSVVHYAWAITKE